MAKGDEAYESKRINTKKVIWFILLLIIVATTAGCLFAPTFNISKIRAIDGEYVTSGEILESAKINLGENIFKISDTKIKQSIEKLPYVKKAKIYRSLPSTIILKVEERQPYAIVKYLESYAITDKFGYILEIRATNTMKDLPIIYGINEDDCRIGQKIFGTSLLKYENSVYIIETAKKVGFNYTFDEINYDDSTNVKLFIKEKNIDIIYGEITIYNIEEKLRHLSYILEKLGDQEGVLDMSNDDYIERTMFNRYTSND